MDQSHKQKDTGDMGIEGHTSDFNKWAIRQTPPTRVVGADRHYVVARSSASQELVLVSVLLVVGWTLRPDSFIPITYGHHMKCPAVLSVPCWPIIESVSRVPPMTTDGTGSVHSCIFRTYHLWLS